MGHIYNMKNELWDVGWTGLQKKVLADYEQLFRTGFLSFHGQKIKFNFF